MENQKTEPDTQGITTNAIINQHEEEINNKKLLRYHIKAGFPVIVVSAEIRTPPLLNGKLEKGSPSKGTNSVKPFSLRAKEFVRFSNLARDLSFTI
ncbi:MAG: hypothetical protein ABSD42_03610 [Candidatus Bathyarchaeia archaeon]|jgi:hypothetical protein